MLHRIERRETFTRLNQKADSARHGPVKVSRVASEPEEVPVAVAFAVPKRYGNAVARNRSRRQMRHILQSFCDQGAVSRGQYLVSLRPVRELPDFGTLERSLRIALGNLDRSPVGESGHG